MAGRLSWLGLIGSNGVLAQCVMCNRTAAAQNAARAAVFNQGIVVLIVPPLLILVGFVYFAWRRYRAL